MYQVEKMLEIRRPRTKPDSPERQLQVKLAKIEAARYLFIRDIRSRDQATLGYLNRNGGLDSLNTYLSDKHSKLYKSIEDLGEEMTFDRVIEEDLYMHMHQDQLTSMNKYANYRWSFFKKIRKDVEKVEALEKRINDYVDTGFHLVKPEDFVPEDAYNLQPINAQGVSE